MQPEHQGRSRAAAVLALALVLAGCSPVAPRADVEVRAVRVPTATAPAPVCVPAPLEERAAQVLVVGLPSVIDPADPLVGALGSLGVGGVLLTETNAVSTDQVRALVAALRAASPRPLLVTTDEELGRVSSFRHLLGASPSPRTPAATSSAQEVRALGRAMGERLAALDVDADLAPVADLADGPAGGVIGDRSWSADAGVATAYTLAFSAGLTEAGVLPTVKHFPGHGRSATDSHLALARVPASLDELRMTDLVPFSAAIREDVPLVMTGHVAYDALDPGLPASLAPRTYALLRELGFEGVAITDALGMGAVNLRWDFPVAAVMAVAAGADALLATQGDRAPVMRDAVVTAVREGRLLEGRLDEAATRVLRLKGVDPRPVTCAGERASAGP